MSEFKCPFCGSTERLVQQFLPDGSEKVLLGSSGEYEPVYEPCCKSQKRNLEYVRNNIDPVTGEHPDIDDLDV